jgi:nucleotide-binding universal stress UspA family protein
VDCSHFSYQVLPYVLSLAEKYDAEIYLLHVVDDLRRFTGIQVSNIFVSDFIRKALSAAENQLDEICDQHLQSCPNFQRIVVEGDPRVEILRAADAHDVDLVVMGSHSRKGLKGALFGSVANYVVKNANVPVMTVRSLE